MQLLSVNVGSLQPLQVGKDTVQTGIFKRPVQGPVSLFEAGLERDHIGNPVVHGGPDQAVYLYTAEDYAYWSEQLGRELGPGFFGENLTVSSLGECPRVGDTYLVGSATLQLTAPRIPCSKLAAKIGQPGFLKTFVAANRAGAYARVLRSGTVQAGEPLARQPASPEWPALTEIFAAWHQNPKDCDFLRRALQAPLAERARSAFERWCQQA